MKKLIALLLALVMVLSLAACGSSDKPAADAPAADAPAADAPAQEAPAEEGVVTLKMMMTATQEPGVSAAVAAFNEAYAGKYEVVVDYLAFDNVFETLEILMGSQSTEYDVIAADGPNIAAYATRGYLKPLSEFITEEEFGWFTAPMQAEVTYKDEIWGLALGDSSQVLYYNTDLLAQAGIEIDFDAVTPDNRLTWEQLVEWSKEAKAVLDPDGNLGITGIEFQQVGRTYQMNMIANGKGGANIAEGGLSVDGVINGDAWIEALTFYQDNVNAGVFSRGIKATEAPSYFMSGKSIFYIGTTQQPTTFASNGFETYGYTYIPCFEGHEDDVKTACGSWTIGMNPYSVKVEGAIELMKYLCLYEGSDIYVSKSGMVPALSRQFDENLLTEKPYMEIAMYEGANTALVRAVTPGFNEYATSVNALWENVRNGADVAESAQNCVDELATAFLEYEE